MIRSRRSIQAETGREGGTQPTLARDTRGLAAYVAVAVLIAVALLVYGGASILGGELDAKYKGQAGAVKSIGGGEEGEGTCPTGYASCGRGVCCPL